MYENQYLAFWVTSVCRGHDRKEKGKKKKGSQGVWSGRTFYSWLIKVPQLKCGVVLFACLFAAFPSGEDTDWYLSEEKSPGP
jgi:hypothetical protein